MNETQQFAAAADRAFASDANVSIEANPLFLLGNDLMSEFSEAEQLRNEAEQRWLSDLRQYRGLYEPDEETRITGSKAFMRKTRVKVESVDARLMDLLFPANGELNFDIEPTPDPSVPRPMKEKLATLLTSDDGAPPEPEKLKEAIKEAAWHAAKKMSTKIRDQLTEARYRDVARKVLHSGNLYGTGIMKGPLVERRERVSYVWQDGEGDKPGKFVQESKTYAAPFVTHVPLWRFYPDMCVTELEDSRYAWEHHRLSKANMVELAERKTFSRDRIRRHLTTYPDGDIRPRTYESELRSIGDQQEVSFAAKSGQYDVFERWGWLDASKLSQCGCEVEPDRMHEVFFANVWVLPDGTVIKAVLQPIEGMRWPYHIYYLDKDETSIFGEGLAAIMRGDQKMLNAAVRMLLDNAAVTAGPQFEVFVPAFPAQANLTDIHPLKVWPRTSGDFQYPAVRPINVASHMPELLEVMRLFDANADEVTAIPKFTYGDNPQKGAAGTMGGLSMLLGQANISLKDLVVSWDEGVTKPFIGGLYHWNMKFSSDDTIKGDYNVLAKGAASLVAKEVRAQALAQFGATLQPEERQRVKWGRYTLQKAEALDLSDVVMRDDEFDEFMQSPENQAAMQQQQMAQRLALAEAEAKLAKIAADTTKAQMESLVKRIEGAYAAMQAAGIAVGNPGVAAGGDAIIKWAEGGQGAGVPDAGSDPNAQVADGEMPPENGIGTKPTSPHAGQRAGIQTAELEQV